MSFIDLCHPKEMVFLAVLVRNRVSILAASSQIGLFHASGMSFYKKLLYHHHNQQKPLKRNAFNIGVN